MRATRIMHASRPLGLVGFVALALAACTSSSSAPAASAGAGGSSTPPSAAVEPTGPGSSIGVTADACELATVAEVGTAYGFTAATATANPPADANYAYCEYASADGGIVVLTYVSLSQIALSIYEGYKAEADETVTGVGDEAFWAGDALYLKKGDAFAAIGIRAGDEGSVDPTEAAVALGKVIAGRM